MSDATCTLPGCDRLIATARLCNMHYKRARRYGAPYLPTVDDLFFRHVTETAIGCWEWDKPKDNGYGQFMVGRRQNYAHRWAYERFVVEIPDGLDLDHLCRNRRCVNPWHLDPVPCRVNLLRSPLTLAGINARKRACVHGHEFTAANTYVTKDGRRQCRTCTRIRGRAHGARRLSEK